MTDESPRDDERDEASESVLNEVREPTDAFVPATEESGSSSGASECEGETGGEAEEDDALGAVAEVNEVVEPTDAFQPATEAAEGSNEDGDGGGARE